MRNFSRSRIDLREARELRFAAEQNVPEDSGKYDIDAFRDASSGLKEDERDETGIDAFRALEEGPGKGVDVQRGIDKLNADGAEAKKAVEECRKVLEKMYERAKTSDEWKAIAATYEQSIGKLVQTKDTIDQSMRQAGILLQQGLEQLEQKVESALNIDIQEVAGQIQKEMALRAKADKQWKQLGADFEKAFAAARQFVGTEQEKLGRIQAVLQWGAQQLGETGRNIVQGIDGMMTKPEAKKETVPFNLSLKQQAEDLRDFWQQFRSQLDVVLKAGDDDPAWKEMHDRYSAQVDAIMNDRVSLDVDKTVKLYELADELQDEYQARVAFDLQKEMNKYAVGSPERDGPTKAFRKVYEALSPSATILHKRMWEQYIMDQRAAVPAGVKPSAPQNLGGPTPANDEFGAHPPIAPKDMKAPNAAPAAAPRVQGDLFRTVDVNRDFSERQKAALTTAHQMTTAAMMGDEKNVKESLAFLNAQLEGMAQFERDNLLDYWKLTNKEQNAADGTNREFFGRFVRDAAGNDWVFSMQGDKLTYRINAAGAPRGVDVNSRAGAVLRGSPRSGAVTAATPDAGAKGVNATTPDGKAPERKPDGSSKAKGVNRVVEMSDTEKQGIVAEGNRILEEYRALGTNPTQLQKEQVKGRLMMAGVSVTDVDRMRDKQDPVKAKEGSAWEVGLNRIMGLVQYAMALMKEMGFIPNAGGSVKKPDSLTAKPDEKKAAPKSSVEIPKDIGDMAALINKRSDAFDPEDAAFKSELAELQRLTDDQKEKDEVAKSVVASIATLTATDGTAYNVLWEKVDGKMAYVVKPNVQKPEPPKAPDDKKPTVPAPAPAPAPVLKPAEEKLSPKDRLKIMGSEAGVKGVDLKKVLEDKEILDAFVTGTDADRDEMMKYILVHPDPKSAFFANLEAAYGGYKFAGIEAVMANKKFKELNVKVDPTHFSLFLDSYGRVMQK